MNKADINFAKIRREYRISELNESKVTSDPLKLFSTWFKAAKRAKILEPNAMCLATSDKKGRVNARMVLLKEFSARGFCFHTNYSSPKANEIKANSYAALVFYWDVLERQVRITGKVIKVSRQESAKYFATRPRNAQIGAWASQQSAKISSRNELIEKINLLKKKFGTAKIPLPPHWGGYILVPDKMEFWQGREGRLHDRLEYKKVRSTWKISRLSP